MIRITYKEFPKEGAMRLRAEGHAGYAPKGQDIVCAAVSTLMQALAFSADCSEEGFARSVEFRRILSCFYTFVRNNAKMKAITFLLAERG